MLQKYKTLSEEHGILMHPSVNIHKQRLKPANLHKF